MLNTYSANFVSSSSQFLSISSPVSLNPTTNHYTIEGWFKTNAIGVNQAIYSSYGSGATALIMIRLNANGTVRMYSRDISASVVTAEITEILSADTWYHFAGVRSGNTTYIYIHDQNGDLVDSDSTTGTLGSVAVAEGTYAPAIGNLNGSSPSTYFNGLIDDLRFWLGVAKSQAQIEASMSEELVGNETNLTGYWKLNNSLLDETSNNNDLTNNHGVTFSSDVPFVGVSDFIPKVIIY